VNIDPSALTTPASSSSGGHTSPTGTGLQINTLKAKQAIQAAFPEITNIGGYAARPPGTPQWHTKGLALDVMIPGGTTRGGANAAGRALGDRIYQFVMAHKAEWGVDYVLWQTDEGGDHYDHLHVNTTGGGYPSSAAPSTPEKGWFEGFASGGPTPDGMGPMDAKGGHLAIVHPGEFVVSKRGRATVPDSFLHALNRGDIDGYALGGPIRQAAVPVKPLPPSPGPPANTIQIPPPAPRRPVAVPSPAAPTTPVPAPVPPIAAGPAPQPQAPDITVSPAGPIIAANTGTGNLNHNLDAINTGIASGASTLGNIAATAVQLGMMAAAAGSSGGAGAGGGLVSSMVSGAFQQGGKIVTDVANVVSSSLVGSVPGSYGGPAGASPSGMVNLSRQARPAPPESDWSGGNKYTFNGYDMREVFQMAQDTEALQRQARLATVRG
jgi:hypothetical protein